MRNIVQLTRWRRLELNYKPGNKGESSYQRSPDLMQQELIDLHRQIKKVNKHVSATRDELRTMRANCCQKKDILGRLWDKTRGWWMEILVATDE